MIVVGPVIDTIDGKFALTSLYNNDFEKIPNAIGFIKGANDDYTFIINLDAQKTLNYKLNTLSSTSGEKTFEFGINQNIRKVKSVLILVPNITELMYGIKIKIYLTTEDMIFLTKMFYAHEYEKVSLDIDNFIFRFEKDMDLKKLIPRLAALYLQRKRERGSK